MVNEKQDNGNVDSNSNEAESGKTMLHINDSIAAFLLETAKWGKFLAIIGFVLTGLMVLGGLAMTVFMSSMFPQEQSSPFHIGGWFGILYILMALMYFFPTLYLYKFSTKIRLALAITNQDELADGFENLKSLFKFMGIFMVVILGIYALFFVGAIVGGAVSSMF